MSGAGEVLADDDAKGKAAVTLRGIEQ
jgi:hypothetical protein